MKLKTVAMWACLAIVMALGVELVSLIAYRILTVQFFSYSSLSEDRMRVLAETTANAPAREEQTGIWAWSFIDSILHPFLGYSRDPKNANAVDTFVRTDVGDTASQSPESRTVVGITGGSVAEGFYRHVASTPEFRRALEQIPRFSGTEIQFVSLGLRGYKQPQQLLAVTYYLSLNEPLDVLINLDGWNELGLNGRLLAEGLSPIYPYHWAALTKDQFSLAYLASAGKVSLLGDLRHRAAEMADRMPYSVTVQLFWRLSDAALKRQVARARIDMSESDESRPYFRVGPQFDGDLAAFYGWSASLWARASADLYALSERKGFEYFHLLQPTPCLGMKTFTEWEERAFLERSCPMCKYITAGYPELQQEGQQLRSLGDFYSDLTGVFEDVSESTYNDACCHLTPGGNAVVATDIARIVKQRLSSSSSSSSERLPD